MGDKFLKAVNLKPVLKKKVELSNDDEIVRCKLCYKGFVSYVALNNHARMEHIDIYLTGDSTQWTEKMTPEPAKTKVESKEMLEVATNALRSISEGTIVQELHLRPAQTNEAEEKKIMVQQIEEMKTKDKKIQYPVSFECKCGSVFFTCCDYSCHYLDEHTNMRRRWRSRCQICEKILEECGDAGMSYPCRLCNIDFETYKLLVVHQNAYHEDLRPFKCDICQKRYPVKGTLQMHMKCHTNERPFKCEVCSKAFTQKAGLHQHMRTHTKEKPFECIICQRKFSQFISLKQHMRTHTNVCPFMCGLCDKRFKQSTALNHHLKKHAKTMTEQERVKYASLLQNGHLQPGKPIPVKVEQPVKVEPEQEVEQAEEITYIFGISESPEDIECETVEVEYENMNEEVIMTEDDCEVYIVP